MGVDVSRYPELANPAEYLKSRGLKLEDVLTEARIERVKGIINSVAEGKQVDFQPRDSVLEFYLTLLVLVNLRVKALIKRFEELEAERLKKLLQRESDDNLLQIAESLGLKLERAHRLYHKRGKETVELKFSTDFISYLQAIKGVKDEKVELKRQVLDSGKVLMTRETLTELLRAILIKVLEDRISQLSTAEVPKALNDVVASFRLKRFPPCMENLMNKKELNEEEKVNLTVFLIAVGYPTKDIVELLKSKGVEEAEEFVKAYIPRKGKAYLPYSCSKLKELGICVSDCGVSNPLQYYFGKLE